MSKGLLPSNKDIQQAAKRNGFDNLIFALGNQLADAGRGVENTFANIANQQNVNRLNVLQKRPTPNSVLEANNIFQNIAINRPAEAQVRQKQAIEDKLVSQGKASKLTDKSRIVNNLATNEIKAVKQVGQDLNKSIDSAISERIARLREAGEPEEKIQEWAKAQRQSGTQQVGQIQSQEAQSSKQVLANTVQGNLEGVNKFKLQRRFNDLENLQGKGDKTNANIGSIALETASRGVVQPLASLGGELASLGAGTADLLTGNQFKLGEKVGNQQKQYNQAFENSLGNEQDLGSGLQQFVGNSAPFLLTPETALARNAAAQAMRLTKTLPFASKSIQNIASKVIGAGVKEGIQDSGLSTIQTAGDLVGAVQRGEMTPQQAFQQAPSQLGVNALGDFVGAGALRGVGDLAGKALKNGLPKVETPRGEEGAIGQTQATPNLTLLEGGKSQVAQDLKTELDEIRSNIQEKLVDVNGEKALLSERSQKRLTKLEKREKELLVALQKYEPNTKQTTTKGLTAKQQAQELAKQINSNDRLQQADRKLTDTPNLPQLDQDIRTLPQVSNKGTEFSSSNPDLEQASLLKNSQPLDNNQGMSQDTRLTKAEQLSPKNQVSDYQSSFKDSKLGKNTQTGKTNQPSQTFKKAFPNGDIAKADFIPPVEVYRDYLYEVKQKLKIGNINEVRDLIGSKTVKEIEGILQKSISKTETPVSAKIAPVETEIPKKSLGTKKVINADGTERVARTLGDYKAVDFQEISRQPERLNKLSDINKTVSKVDEDAVDLISDLAKQKKTTENTLVDLSEALEKKLKDKGIDPSTYQYKGIQLFPGKGKDSLNLNSKGQKILNRYEKMLDRLGLGERLAKGESNSLSVQTNLAKASNAKIGVQNSIDDLAEQIIKSRGDLPKISKQFNIAKDGFMANVATKLENGGLDHVWSNKTGDTAFHIARAKSEFQGEAKELLSARREQLKQRQDTSRTIQGKYETKLKDAETGKAVTTASKKFKSVYQELNEKLEAKTAERMSTERDGDFANTVNKASEFVEKDLTEGKPDKEIVDETTKGFKKLDKQFGFNPLAIPVIGTLVKKIIDGNGLADSIELAYNITPIGNQLDKVFKNAEFTNMKNAAFDLVMNTPKTIDQEILSIKNPKNEKFVAKIQKLEASKMLHEAKLADKSDEISKEIQDLLEKRKVDDILDAEGNIRPEFENSKAAEALAEMADRKREMVEVAEDFKDELIESRNSIDKKIQKLESQEKTPTVKRSLDELKKEKLDLEKTLINVDNKIGSLKVINGNKILQSVQSAAYKGALFWNPSVAFLNLFDYANVRSAPELQTSKGIKALVNTIPFLGDVDRALYETLGQKLGKKPDSLLNFIGSAKRGSYYNVMSDASLAKKSGKNMIDWVKNNAGKWSENLDPNKLIADFYHDVTAVASAKSWLADNPQYKGFPDPVKNFRAFIKEAPREAQISFMQKMSIDLGLIAGRGSKGTDFALGGMGNSELGQSYLAFTKPVYRISNSLRRASTDFLDGINGFKKEANGTFVFDVKKTNSEKAFRGLSSLIATTGGMYLVGGSTAAIGLPVIGSVMNFMVRALVPEDEREEFKDNFNKYSLANKKLLPGLGERIQIQNRNLGEKDSVMGMIKQRFRTLGQPLMASYIQSTQKAIDMTYKYFAGEDVDKEKLKKEWLKLIPTGQLFNKIDQLLNDKEKTIYDTEGLFPREIGTVKTKGDARLLLGAGNEEVQNIKQADQVKQQTAKSLNNLKFTGRPGKLLPQMTDEGKRRLKANIDRYMKFNPTANRNKVEKDLIESARKKYLEKHPEMKKPTKPQRYKEVRYAIVDEEDDDE